jgi:putative PIN family toxin of toxin-antitoxin system
MRMLLDSNILARATPGRDSPAVQVLLLAADPLHELIASEYLLGELARVLRYERLRRIHGLSDAEIDQYVGHVRSNSQLIELPADDPDKVVLGDPDDDPIVATAILGQADVLCTLDRHLRQPDVKAYCEQFHVRILSDVELLAELRQIGASVP